MLIFFITLKIILPTVVICYDISGIIKYKLKFMLMKKNVLCFCLLFAGLNFFACTDMVDDMDKTSNMPVPQLDANALSSNLKESFASSTRAVDGRIIYPDFYGGSFLDVETNKFVILVKDASKSVYEKDLETRCGGKGFEVQSCVYSYGYLIDLIYSLEDKWKKADPNNAMKYYGICTDQERNKLVINTGNISQSNKQRFIDLLDGFDNIEFILSDEMIYQADINPGSGMIGALTSSGYSGGSIGYRAKTSAGTPVLVVSGHVMKTINTAMKNRSQVDIGKCINVKWTGISGSTVDAAICSLNTGYVPSNVVKLFSGSVTLGTGVANVDQYSNVSMKGYHTETSGNVIATDYHVPNSSMYNFIKANYASRSGDSGGICYTNDKKVVGIHQGALSESGTERTIIVPAGQINSVFSLKMY